MKYLPVLAVTAVLFLYVFPGKLNAANPTFGPNLLVSDAISGSSIAGPAVLDVDVAKSIYVAWVGRQNSVTEIFFSKLTQSNGSFNSTQPLTGINDTKSFPQIEEDSGNIYIAWGERRVINGVSKQAIFFTKSTDGGQTFSEEAVVDFNDELPISLVAHDGKIYLAYSKFVSNYAEIWVASSQDSGNSFTKTKVTDASVAGTYAQRPAIDFSQNNVHIFWLDNRIANRYQVFYANSQNSGTTFSTNRSIFSHPNSGIHNLGNTFGRLSTAVSQEGNVFLAFDFYLQTPSPTTTDFEVFFTKSTDGGDTFSQAKRLSDDSPTARLTQESPSLSVLPDGSPVIAWRDCNGGCGQIKLSYSDDKGDSFSPNIRINNTTGNNASAHSIVADREGKIHFVRKDGVLTPPGIWYTEIDLGLNFPLIPYFSQKDPAWGSDEYDHANSIGPFFCGSTLAGCGCAVTSAAMILKYYGVNQSPSGEPTNPETLNNWLKSRRTGYNNGDINWIDVTKYALEANKIFGTPKIDYLGHVNSENFSLLNEDLNSAKPAVLQVVSSRGIHFLIATGILGSTYTINDPISVSNTTLQSYSNHFKTMRRYSLTNTNLSSILLTIPAPGEILIIDSVGRKLGKDPVSGETFNEIPNGTFYLQSPITDDTLDDPPIAPEGSGNYYIEILDPQAEEYTVQVGGENLNAIFLGYDQNADVSSDSFAINGNKEFKINYSPEPGSTIDVTQIVDIDIKPGSAKNVIELKEDDDETTNLAVFTTPDFDAKTLDVESVTFGPGLAREIHRLKKKKNFDKEHFKDIDKDGDLDLILHFRLRDTGLRVSDTQACLVGKTKSGKSIQGCDLVKVVFDE